jgi:peptidoglycan/xylan/chitin deacetylase (PgdA/CDA1 family)
MTGAREIAKDLLQRSLLRGAFRWRLDDARSTALTFDDGPDPQHTPAMIEMLARHGVQATFFVVGERARRYPQLMREIAAHGHTIGSHTHTHRVITELSREELARELDLCGRVIADTTGQDETRLLRPPKGRISPASLLRARALGYCVVHWSVTYSDYLRDGLDSLLARIRARPPRPRDIVLMHDVVPESCAALERMLPAWQAEGRMFVGL